MHRFLQHIVTVTVSVALASLATARVEASALQQKTPPRTAKEPETAEEAVQVKVVVVGEAKAGTVVRVAATFTIHPGWHIYWENAGESGMPTSVTFELPKDCNAAKTASGALAIDFPTPQVFTHGETTFGYEKTVTLSVPVTLPSALPAGGLPIKVGARWLVCKERCLMGTSEAAVDLTKPIAADSADAAPLRAALASMPKPTPSSWTIALSEITADSAVVTIDTHASAPIRFLPGDTAGVSLDEGFMASSKDGKLQAKLRLSRESAVGAAMNVAGIVLLGNEPTGYAFHLPLEGPQGKSPAGKEVIKSGT